MLFLPKDEALRDIDRDTRQVLLDAHMRYAEMRKILEEEYRDRLCEISQCRFGYQAELENE